MTTTTTTIFKAAAALALIATIAAGVLTGTSAVSEAREAQKIVKIDVAKYQAWPYR